MIRKTTIKTVHMLGLLVLLLSACGSSTSADAPAIETLPQVTTSDSQETTEVPVDITALTMTVYKSPTCSCCQDWVDYMASEGFSVTTVDTDDVDSIKAEHGLTAPELKSCHTALIDGYLIEGHVPANDVKRLLDKRPDIVGLTAPGMPMMSPGMGSVKPKDYNVLSFQENGRTRTWSAY